MGGQTGERESNSMPKHLCATGGVSVWSMHATKFIQKLAAHVKHALATNLKLATRWGGTTGLMPRWCQSHWS